MIEEVHSLLLEYEGKQAAGEIEKFRVVITANALHVHPQPVDACETKSMALTAELLTTLQIFFSGIDGITYNSYDYITLKSLLNAHGTLERMAKNIKK